MDRRFGRRELGVLPLRFLNPVGSIQRPVENRRGLADHCRGHLRDRFPLSDRTLAPGGAARDRRRNHRCRGRRAFSVGLFTISAILFSSRLKREAYWKPWHTVLFSLAWLWALLLFVLIAVVVSKVPSGGVAEKAFILDRNIWALVLTLLAFNSPGTLTNVVKR
jgi:hypothetical protein